MRSLSIGRAPNGNLFMETKILFKLNNYKSFLAILLLFLAAWTLPKQSFATPAPAGKEPSPWTSILELLNRESTIRKPVLSPFSHELNTDLLALNEAELQVISKAWMALPQSSQPPKSVAGKRAKNEFFHKQIQALNDEVFTKIEKDTAASTRAKKDVMELAVSILAQLAKNPVAKLEASQRYDPSGELGFCFGRALFVHYRLLQAGVAPHDIAKIFSVGQLRVGQQLWKSHVAVMVRNASGAYLVVDPLYEKPLALKEWKDRTAAYDIKGQLSRARFYVTDARKFLPAYGAYSIDQLEEKHLKSYFRDLALSLTP